MAADQERDVVAPARRRGVDAVDGPGVAAAPGEVTLVAPRHAADDLEVLFQDRHPLRQVRERLSEGLRLTRLEARAQAQHEPAAADGVDRAGCLGRHRRVAEGRVDDGEPDFDPRNSGGNCRS